MNRSILIVICDFLLVSLVAFSSFDTERLERPPERTAASKQGDATQDVMGSLKLALEDEKLTRERLSSDLRTQQEALAQREAKIKEYQDSLRRTEEQARQIEQQRSQLAQQFAAAQTSLQDVQLKFDEASKENLISKEKLEALQADLKKREQEAQNLQGKLSEAEKSYHAAIMEKQQLTAQLQVSEVEKRLTREQVQELRGEVANVKEEKTKLQETTTKLADSVGTLAQKSTELTQEIRENRPLAANTVFHEFTTNRMATQFKATRSGLFNRDVDKDKVSQSILMHDGTQTYALFHVEDTPVMLWNPGTDWSRLSAVMSRGAVAFSAVRLSFLAQDPRILVIPIGDAQAKQFGTKIYKTAPDPFKFQEAIIVGANEGYYGECAFKIDSSTPGYVKVDRNLIKGLFGKFNPTRGDLVLSRTGELLGIMVNNDYCAVLGKVVPTRTIMCGDNIASQQTGQLLSQLYDRVFQMPVKLQ